MAHRAQAIFWRYTAMTIFLLLLFLYVIVPVIGVHLHHRLCVMPFLVSKYAKIAFVSRSFTTLYHELHSTGKLTALPQTP